MKKMVCEMLFMVEGRFSLHGGVGVMVFYDVLGGFMVMGSG